MTSKLIIAGIVVLLVAGFFVFGGPGAEERQTIKFADTQFETLWINNAIAQYIIEHGYEHPVETVELSTAVMQQSLANGDIHVQLELWRMNVIDWYNEVTEAGHVIDLGPVYERSTQGWYVPRYIIEGDANRGIEPLAPDLRSVGDLAQYKHIFPDPEDPDMGALVNCIIGWQCQRINEIKLHAYALADHYNLIEVGSAAAMDSVIISAYQRGEPILTYYWEPTSIMGAFDFVQLEEPEFTAECNQEIQRVLMGEKALGDVDPVAGCAYEEHAIHKGIHRSLEEIAPDVVAFLRNMNVGTDPLNQTLAYMMFEEAEPNEAAIWFFENFGEIWRGWLPANVVTRVEDALQQAGAQI